MAVPKAEAHAHPRAAMRDKLPLTNVLKIVPFQPHTCDTSRSKRIRLVPGGWSWKKWLDAGKAISNSPGPLGCRATFQSPLCCKRERCQLSEKRGWSCCRQACQEGKEACGASAARLVHPLSQGCVLISRRIFLGCVRTPDVSTQVSARQVLGRAAGKVPPHRRVRVLCGKG